VFVPSLTSLFQLANGAVHALHLHAGEGPLLDALAAFFDLALRRGDATCVMATERIRAGLGERLRARGWNVGGPTGHARYRAVDAAAALDRFMRNGLPDEDRLAEIAAELEEYRLAVAEGASSRLAIFGNMTALLIADGLDTAAVALESLWTRLSHGLPFLTLCGYETSCLHDGVPTLWPGVNAQHLALSHASDV
jgi:hypothetical protein